MSKRGPVVYTKGTTGLKNKVVDYLGKKQFQWAVDSEDVVCGGHQILEILKVRS